MSTSLSFLVFCVNDRRCALNLSQVQRVIRSVEVTPLSQAPGIVVGIIDLHGTIVPVLNIRERFNYFEREISVDHQFVIASTAAGTAALLVDRVVGVIEQPAEQIVAAEMISAAIGQTTGVLRLEDGMALIQDLDHFLSTTEQHELKQALSKSVN